MRRVFSKKDCEGVESDVEVMSGSSTMSFSAGANVWEWLIGLDVILSGIITLRFVPYELNCDSSVISSRLVLGSGPTW